MKEFTESTLYHDYHLQHGNQITKNLGHSDLKDYLEVWKRSFILRFDRILYFLDLVIFFAFIFLENFLPDVFLDLMLPPNI